MPIITIRLPDSTVARIDRQLARLRESIHPIRVSRADVMRRLLELGLVESEKKQGARKGKRR